LPAPPRVIRATRRNSQQIQTSGTRLPEMLMPASPSGRYTPSRRPRAAASHNRQLCRRSEVAASAANLQQNLAFRLKPPAVQRPSGLPDRDPFRTTAPLLILARKSASDRPHRYSLGIYPHQNRGTICSSRRKMGPPGEGERGRGAARIRVLPERRRRYRDEVRRDRAMAAEPVAAAGATGTQAGRVAPPLSFPAARENSGKKFFGGSPAPENRAGS
jgi:hypothetical protein